MADFFKKMFFVDRMIALHKHLKVPPEKVSSFGHGFIIKVSKLKW